MKTIGILGGASWASTIPIYSLLNEEIGRRLGGHHSAKIILYSIDYAPIKALYHERWDAIPLLFKNEFERLLSLKPDCLLLACHTLHKAFNLVQDQIDLSIPFFHSIELTKKEILDRGLQRVLFLGTRFTMEDSYFMKPLIDAGIELILPNEEEKQSIQEIQAQLSKGLQLPSFKIFFSSLLSKYSDCEGAVLACTELPLIIDASLTSVPLIDPVFLQCQAAVNYVLKT